MLSRWPMVADTLTVWRRRSATATTTAGVAVRPSTEAPEAPEAPAPPRFCHLCHIDLPPTDPSCDKDGHATSAGGHTLGGRDYCSQACAKVAAASAAAAGGGAKRKPHDGTWWRRLVPKRAELCSVKAKEEAVAQFQFEFGS
jgi:hypothetical protein